MADKPTITKRCQAASSRVISAVQPDRSRRCGFRGRELRLPDGQNTSPLNFLSSPLDKNISLPVRCKSVACVRRLVPQGGAARDRHGRRERDAVDAGVLPTNGTEVDGEVVWSRRPDAGVKSVRSKLLRGEGGKQARSPGRARRKPLKPLPWGMPGSSGVTVVTISCAFYFAREAAGALGARHSLRPLYQEDRIFTCTNSRAGGEKAKPRLRLAFSCHHPRKRVIQYSRGSGDGIEKPRRTGSPGRAGR
jgi:hypothetical protein